MKFTNPNGLWLLLGIPILIIIYLIKSKHEDRPMSSTYLWRLSRRFAKKRLPLRRLNKFLLFLLQLLMIAIVSLMAAKPVISDGERYNYIVIIDASAGMQMEDNKGNSRFERAVMQTNALAKELSNGHTMSVILAADTAACLVQDADSESEVNIALESAECTNGICDIGKAVEMAQKMCDRSENARVLFYTDRDPKQAGNVHLVNLDSNEQNISIEGLLVENKENDLVFTGKMRAYPKDASVAVGLRLDGKTVDAQIVNCSAEKSTEVIFTVKDTETFETAEIYIEKKDGFAPDNSYALCRKSNKINKILLVSKSPLYLQSALNALGNCQVTVATELDDASLSGKDLYVFDGIVPDEYPKDGSVVVFGTENLPNGLTVGAGSEEVCNLMMDNSEDPICKDMVLSSVVVKKYTDLVGNSLWQEVLFCKEAVVMVTSERENGTRFSVFSFDLHDTNLPLQQDFLLLMRNLVEFSIPGLIGDTQYTVSDTVKIAVLPGMDELYLQCPDGSVRTLYAKEDVSTVTVNETGVYTVVAKGEKTGAYADFFVALPMGEPYSDAEDVINIAIKRENEVEKKEALSGIWFWLAIAVLLVLLIEWEWYYYEQY